MTAPNSDIAAIAAARAAAIEECARWHDWEAEKSNDRARASSYKTAEQHWRNAQQHRYAAEQLRALKAKG